MTNLLKDETSPYLRQHAANPVNWRPWTPEALALARSENKPILLSIGYSACHWCHVMAHESFEDEATAQSMNDKFVCIKVDREERPDIDKIYQLAHQALTRRGGGWPLTMFLAPDDLAPFYAGTYFPKAARYGMPPFAYVLDQVRRFWDEQRDAVRQQNGALREFLLGYGSGPAHTGVLGDAPLRAALVQIEQHFDATHGGHLGAPKFPHGAEMELLLDMASLGSGRLGTPPEAVTPPDVDGSTLADSAPASIFSRDEKARAEQMVGLSLTRIAQGGIHDQIGGGFCRYSVDERWEIPHFEKMLYDNAQLLPLYASRVSRAPVSEQALYAAAVQRLVQWLSREMTAPDGAFYAALDADSEGHEGKFYVWTQDDVDAVLSDAQFAVAERYYGFTRAANFEGKAWNPIVAESTERVAELLHLHLSDVETDLESARAALFAARAQRVRPGLDDKILTAWNALMIGGLARASRALAQPELVPLAGKALAALQRNAWRDGRLYASFDGRAARFPAYLDDHAFLLDALLEYLQCEWHDGYLAWAIALADTLLQRFEDGEHGGFFFTAHDHEDLIQRPKPWADDAIPAGNGVAARALLRLGHLLGETRYLEAAERTLRAACSTMLQTAQGCATLQRALLDYLHPRTLVVVRVADSVELATWRAAVDADSLRREDVYFVPAAAQALRGTLAQQTYAAGGVAYVCRGTQCDAPIGSAAGLRDRIAELVDGAGA